MLKHYGNMLQFSCLRGQDLGQFQSEADHMNSVFRRIVQYFKLNFIMDLKKKKFLT